MRDMTQLHPRLQILALRLMAECAHVGISIRIGECVRTVAEQDALYAQGRTKPGIIVTKCKGSTYSSMHQWGIAFDFFLDMDIDGDGQKSDDAYNDKLGTFRKVGKIGQALGLEWGGDWQALVDKPHFQLPDWGSTATKLKKLYGTPDVFRQSWYPSIMAINTKSSKEDIKWLQEQLTKYAKGCKIAVDGDYGPKTRLAVLSYWQQLGWNKDLKDDGTRVGKATINALVSGRKE